MATFPPLTTGFAWQNPTTNTDGSAVAAGELTSTDLGIRADGDTTHGPGNYLFLVNVVEPTTVESVAALTTALGKALAPGDYWAAARSDTANGDSVWSTPEQPFSIPVPPPPIPNPPVLSVS